MGEEGEEEPFGKVSVGSQQLQQTPQWIPVLTPPLLFLLPRQPW